jgi:hypothetical protein
MGGPDWQHRRAVGISSHFRAMGRDLVAANTFEASG